MQFKFWFARKKKPCLPKSPVWRLEKCDVFPSRQAFASVKHFFQWNRTTQWPYHLYPNFIQSCLVTRRSRLGFLIPLHDREFFHEMLNTRLRHIAKLQLLDSNWFVTVRWCRVSRKWFSFSSAAPTSHLLSNICPRENNWWSCTEVFALWWERKSPLSAMHKCPLTERRLPTLFFTTSGWRKRWGVFLILENGVHFANEAMSFECLFWLNGVLQFGLWWHLSLVWWNLLSYPGVSSPLRFKSPPRMSTRWEDASAHSTAHMQTNMWGWASPAASLSAPTERVSHNEQIGLTIQSCVTGRNFKSHNFASECFQFRLLYQVSYSSEQ